MFILCYYIYFYFITYYFLLVSVCKVTDIFGIIRRLEKVFLYCRANTMYTSSLRGMHYVGLAIRDRCIFQFPHSRFVTLRFRHQKCHSYGAKPWHFWVVTHRVTRTKWANNSQKEIDADFHNHTLLPLISLFLGNNIYMLQE